MCPRPLAQITGIIDQLANYYAIHHRPVGELTQDVSQLVVDETTIILSIVTPRSDLANVVLLIPVDC